METDGYCGVKMALFGCLDRIWGGTRWARTRFSSGKRKERLKKLEEGKRLVGILSRMAVRLGRQKRAGTFGLVRTRGEFRDAMG